MNATLRLRAPVLAALSILLFSLNAPASDAPGAGSPPAGSEPFKSYPCDASRSNVAYHAVHPFAKVNGVNRAPACTVWASPDTSAFRIRVSMPVRGFKSGIVLRDSHAMKAIAADSFPTVSFSSEAARPKAGRMGPYTVAGELTFMGKTRSIQVEATPEIKDGAAVIRGGFPISLAEYQAKPPSLMGTKVKDKVEMTFELVFKL